MRDSMVSERYHPLASPPPRRPIDGSDMPRSERGEWSIRRAAFEPVAVGEAGWRVYGAYGEDHPALSGHVAGLSGRFDRNARQVQLAVLHVNRHGTVDGAPGHEQGRGVSDDPLRERRAHDAHRA